MLAALKLPIRRWTHRCQRTYESVVRRAATLREPTVKPIPIPEEVLVAIIDKVFPPGGGLWDINLVEARTAIGAVLQYYTLCR